MTFLLIFNFSFLLIGSDGPPYLSVIGTMVLLKGHHSIEQCHPMMPIKCGYKLRMIANMNGYINKFGVYQGKSDTAPDQNKRFVYAKRVVLNICDHILNKDYDLRFANTWS